MSDDIQDPQDKLIQERFESMAKARGYSVDRSYDAKGRPFYTDPDLRMIAVGFMWGLQCPR